MEKGTECCVHGGVANYWQRFSEMERGRGGWKIHTALFRDSPPLPHRQNRPDFNMKAGKTTSEKYKWIKVKRD
jgi:hypothetical protein